MTAVWPEALGIPRRQTFGLAHADVRMAKTAETGPPGYRRRGGGIPKTMQVSLALDRNGIAILENFHEFELKGGTLPFWMADPMTDGIQLQDGETGEPLLTHDGQEILMSVIFLYLFGPTPIQIGNHGTGFLASFDLVQLP
jgi:hypothetical protein